MRYVVKKERLKNYLFNLGYDYKEVPDRTGRQKYVWLFENTEEFKEAITFYTNLKNRRQNKPNYECT